jgi:hypothetical protein
VSILIGKKNLVENGMENMVDQHECHLLRPPNDIHNSFPF